MDNLLSFRRIGTIYGYLIPGYVPPEPNDPSHCGAIYIGRTTQWRRRHRQHAQTYRVDKLLVPLFAPTTEAKKHETAIHTRFADHRPRPRIALVLHGKR